MDSTSSTADEKNVESTTATPTGELADEKAPEGQFYGKETALVRNNSETFRYSLDFCL
jgi:hypothetical protein